MCAVWTACTLGVKELGKAGVFIQFFPSLLSIISNRFGVIITVNYNSFHGGEFSGLRDCIVYHNTYIVTIVCPQIMFSN